MQTGRTDGTCFPALHLIALHESHNDIGANQNQSLYYTKGCNDLVRLRKSGCCNIGERGGHGQANLDNCCGDSD